MSRYQLFAFDGEPAGTATGDSEAEALAARAEELITELAWRLASMAATNPPRYLRRLIRDALATYPATARALVGTAAPVDAMYPPEAGE